MFNFDLTRALTLKREVKATRVSHDPATLPSFSHAAVFAPKESKKERLNRLQDEQRTLLIAKKIIEEQLRKLKQERTLYDGSLTDSRFPSEPPPKRPRLDSEIDAMDIDEDQNLPEVAISSENIPEKESPLAKVSKNGNIEDDFLIYVENLTRSNVERSALTSQLLNPNSSKSSPNLGSSSGLVSTSIPGNSIDSLPNSNLGPLSLPIVLSSTPVLIDRRPSSSALHKKPSSSEKSSETAKLNSAPSKKSQKKTGNSKNEAPKPPSITSSSPSPTLTSGNSDDASRPSATKSSPSENPPDLDSILNVNLNSRPVNETHLDKSTGSKPSALEENAKLLDDIEHLLGL